MKKIIATSVGLIAVLLGSLWFLQGADILHIRPILCFADCAYIKGGSRFWEITGALLFVLGIAILTVSTSLINCSTLFQPIREWDWGAEEISEITNPTIFFLLVAALSIPFYLLGISGARMPGLSFLPANSLMTFVPMIAAMILVYRKLGLDGVKSLAKRAFDFNRMSAASWVVVALLFMLAVSSLEYIILRFIGVSLPTPQIAASQASFAFIAFFIGAIGEELGWQGYAYPALRKKHSALVAAIFLGVIWALWHVIPYVQLEQDTNWIFWQCLCAIALRIIIVWLYENTNQSVFIAVLFHTMINVSWLLYPITGSYYQPFVTFLILALAAGVIVFYFGPKMLNQTAGKSDGV